MTDPVDALFAGASQSPQVPQQASPHAAVDALFASVPAKKTTGYPLTGANTALGLGELAGTGVYNLIPALVNSANDLVHIGGKSPPNLMNYQSPGVAGQNVAQKIGALPIPGMNTDAQGRLATTGNPVTLSDLVHSFGRAASQEKPWLNAAHPYLAAPIEKVGRAAWDVANIAPDVDIARGIGGALRRTPAVLTKEELATQANAAYERAKNAGVVVKPERFQGLQSSLSEDLTNEGIDPTLHPATTAAVKRITDAQGPQSLQQLEILRRVAKGAEATQNPADRRLAANVVDHLDDFMENLKPQDVTAGNAQEGSQALVDARNFWSRKRKADVIDELMDRAQLSAPQFSGSGLENAIRTEFRGLAKNQRRMRTFTPEEQDSIRKVAMGGPVENTLRMLGKFAPTGVVSSALSGGLGMLAGGPLGAAALPTGGFIARQAATRMTMRNAAKAGELMRRGPSMGLLEPQLRLPRTTQ